MDHYEMYNISEENVEKYQVRRFPWQSLPKEKLKINNMYLRAALIARRQRESYKEIMNGADFIAYLGILEALSRAWCEPNKLRFTVIRVQGVILLNFTTKRSLDQITSGLEQEEIIRNNKYFTPQNSADLKVKHYHVTGSELWNGGEQVIK
ncbi:hypothetical protein PENTCL1PPCAC_29993, partial [Pristionchus entomophagus]